MLLVTRTRSCDRAQAARIRSKSSRGVPDFSRSAFSIAKISADSRPREMISTEFSMSLIFPSQKKNLLANRTLLCCSQFLYFIIKFVVYPLYLQISHFNASPCSSFMKIYTNFMNPSNKPAENMFLLLTFLRFQI